MPSGRRACVADSPNGPRAVVGHHQRSIRGNCHAYGPAPHVFVVNNETGHEVFVFSAGTSSLVPRGEDQSRLPRLKAGRAA